MKFISRFKRSKIVSKLTKKMLLSYSAIYITIFILLITILFPRLYNESYNKAAGATELIANEYYELQDQMVSYLDFFAFSKPTENAIINYLDEPSDYNVSTVEQELQDFLARYNKIKLVIIESAKGDIFTSFNFSSNENIPLLLQENGYQALKNYTYGYYYSAIKDDYLRIPDKEGFSTCAVSKKYYFDGNPFILTLVFNSDTTLKNTSEFSSDILDNYVVMDKNQTIFYTTNTALTDIVTADDFEIPSNTFKNLIVTKGAYFREYIPSSSYTIIAYTSTRTLFKDIIVVMLIVILLYFIPPLLYWFILVPINIHYLSPLKTLSDTMTAYSIGKDLISDIHTNDEIEELSNVFNNMMANINHQVTEIVAQEQENARTKYRLLVTQIDPHFIYNTMNIINILARRQNTKDIIKVNSALTRILQDRLSVKSGIFETVENEIAAIKEYLVIINYRYANNIDFQFEIEESVLSVYIPKNLLQPLIENAIFHGLTDENGAIKGNINIIIYALENKIIIEVSDNGKGISSESLKGFSRFEFNAENDKKTHIGLENIYQRLCYIYEDNNRMRFQSELGYGTTIILTLDRLDNSPNITLL